MLNTHHNKVSYDETSLLHVEFEILRMAFHEKLLNGLKINNL